MSSFVSPPERLFRLLRSEKKEISAIYFFAALSGLIQLSLPLGIQSIVGFVMGGVLSTSLIILIVVVVLGVAWNGQLQINQMKLIERIQQRLFVRYSLAFAHHIPRLDLQTTDALYLPELVNRFFDIPQLQKSISKILLDFPIAVTQIILGLLVLAFYHPAFIAFGVLLILVLYGIFYITGNKGIQTSNAKSTYKYAVAAWLEELARGVNSFKHTSHTGMPMTKADATIVHYIEARKSHFSILLLQYRVLVVFKVLITAAMLIVGCLLLLDEQINIGQFIAAEIIIILVINSVEKLIVDLDVVYGALTSVEKINKVLDKPAEKEGTLTLPEEPVSIQCEDLAFGYEGEEAVLHRLSFTIGKGDKVCICGDNSSGKSTLLKLLTGAYSQDKGSLRINEIPVGNYALTSLRSRTGVVMNGEDIFSGTLWQNLTMGNANVDASEALRLCQQTGLHTYLSTLPKGFDTELLPTGKSLPQNVIQRILLVRALLQKPSLLLVEEPAENITGEDRKKIYDLLLNLPQTTVIAVSADEAFQAACHQTLSLTQYQNTKS